MELADRVAIVTGGGSGIGRALASSLVRESVRNVVIADLDEARAKQVADQLGARAVARGCDVATESEVLALIEDAEQRFGRVDLFFANAGVAEVGGAETSDEVWRRAMDTNLMGHIYAARHLVPRWIERGEGYMVVTASAAGLLTQLGSASYTVSKHAAVAFAEWLAISYGSLGVRVSCICPMMVNTPMLTGGANGSEREEVLRTLSDVLEPEDVARAAIEGIRSETFLILPHDSVRTHVRRRADDPQRWLASMQRLQARLLGG